MSIPSLHRHGPRRVTARTAFLGSAAILLAACARNVAVESEPGPTYSIQVVNPMPHPMIVSYDDGSGERLLGTVPADGEEWFTIADPAGRTVTIIAVDRNRTHTVRRSVALETDESARVVLSP